MRFNATASPGFGLGSPPLPVGGTCRSWERPDSACVITTTTPEPAFGACLSGVPIWGAYTDRWGYNENFFWHNGQHRLGPNGDRWSRFFIDKDGLLRGQRRGAHSGRRNCGRRGTRQRQGGGGSREQAYALDEMPHGSSEFSPRFPIRLPVMFDHPTSA